jgi:hypothetical protein
MTSITIPDDLAERVRVRSGDEGVSVPQMVARALERYLTESDREAMIRETDEIEAQLIKAGITEEDLVRWFHEWRREDDADR